MQRLAYVPFERLSVNSPVDRMSFVADACRGRIVLDLGCFDETALVKQGTRYWLHGEIARVAKRVIGIDSSEQIPPEGMASAPNARIVRGDVARVQDIALGEDVEVVVAGELLEHLADPSAFLTNLRHSFPGRELVLTTPNATSLSNVMLGLSMRESSHADHLQVFSFKLLNTLCLRAGFPQWDIMPYRVEFTELALRSRGIRRSVVRAAEAAVHLGERMFPLLSGGMILHVVSM